MSSRWNPWDFFKSHPDGLPSSEYGVWALNFFDPFVEEIFKSKLRGPETQELRLYVGNELSLDWWEGEFQSLDLFITDCFYLILAAKDIPKPLQAKILEDLKNLGEKGQKQICFCFNGASPFYDQLGKLKTVAAHKIEAPKFWEWNKYLLFLAEAKKFPLNYETEQYLLDVLNPSGEEFARAIDLLKLAFKEPQGLKRADLQKLFGHEHLDFFKLASLFGSKMLIKFYEEVMPFTGDYDLMRSFCGFMQSHLLKILDPSYLQEKNRLSKYDQEILAHSKKWRARELMQAVRLFGTLEKMAKEQSHQLGITLRETYLETLSPISIGPK